ncbi:hypothetical protein NT6N_14550 [Oceaniferula spumae]|uniref:Endonuclease/exonuclease/phosphatase domain-containing protein n=1 Tax=Oceaniferula spumae TaxID=2979115 RepID=A0AAT9FK89_9BACT
MTRNISKLTILTAIITMAFNICRADEPMVVTTWNIEHLGSPGRGFGGGFGGFGRYSQPLRRDELPRRTPEQLKNIAKFIHTNLKSDIIALQEVAITHQRRHRSLNKPLDQITAELNILQEGANWSYFLPYTNVVPEEEDERNMFVGFLWNQKRVRLVKVFEMSMVDQVLAGKELFARKPMIGYFEEVREDGSPGIDFVLVNIHLASGQEHDENHLIAMTLIEFGIAMDLAKHAVSEPSVIILGDFNENPEREDEEGKALTSPAMAEHMKFKGYINLTLPTMEFTRMNNKLNSLIDHVMVNRSAQALLLEPKAEVYKPGGGLLGNKEMFAPWRQTYSDHFPLSFKIKSGHDNDSDFFE